MNMAELYPAGQAVTIGSLHFSAEEIVRFARQFDPQPFHLDAEAAKDTLFGGLCASGWHSAAGWMKTFVAFWQDEAERLRQEGKVPPRLGPSPGFSNLQWLKPVFAGDTVTYSVALKESRPLKSRPGLILNTTLNEGVNQKGDPVLRFESAVLEYA